MRQTLLRQSNNGPALMHASPKYQCTQPGKYTKCLLNTSRPITSSPRLHPLSVAVSGVEGGVSDGEYVEEFEGFREKDRGYTPFEFIEFTNLPLKHEVSIWVDLPVADVYKIWDNRLNWMQWFDMIDEVGFHEEQPKYISMYLWYRWATTPFLELYVTLERTQEEVNKYILEEPVEGFPLVSAVLFQEGDESAGESSGTTVTLRMSYLLPKILQEFAGQMAVYGDVDRKLQKCMAKMKDFAEGINVAELEAVRRENEEQIRANFAEQRVLKADVLRKRAERVKEWEVAAAETEEVGETSSEYEEESDEEGDDLLDSDFDSDVDEDVPGSSGDAGGKTGVKTQHSMPVGGQNNPAAQRRTRKSSGTAAAGS